MSKDTKRFVDDTMLVDDFILLQLNSSSTKHDDCNRTGFLDLSDQILLKICRYLYPAYVLHSFYTPERPDMSLHRVISNYYKTIKFDGIINNQYEYLLSLLYYSKYILQCESLTLSNERITYLIQRYFSSTNIDLIQAIFARLKHLSLINCSPQDLEDVQIYATDLSKLEHLRITGEKLDEKQDMHLIQGYNASMNRLIFGKQLNFLHTISIEVHNGLVLNKSLKPCENLRNVNLILQTIDDLYVLLDGLVPNVQILMIELCQPRLLTCARPKSTLKCPQLIEFTLLEPRIGLIIDDIKCIFGYMSSLNKLTLSIRDTSDPIFCHGPSFESILNEYLPYLHQFNYTMTHRIVDQALIEDFIRWPMDIVFYENENCQWVHIYSLPWPLNKDDKRRLPIVQNGCIHSVRSDVKRTEYIDHVMMTKADQFIELNTRFRRTSKITTCSSIDIELPERIAKIIFTQTTPKTSMKSIIQPSVRHLIVERRLIDENEILNLAHQFPNIKYLELLFPLDKSSFIRCLKSLFHRNENLQEIDIWPNLINFTSKITYPQTNLFTDDETMHQWLFQNTDLKYYTYPFHVHYTFSSISIWF